MAMIVRGRFGCNRRWWSNKQCRYGSVRDQQQIQESDITWFTHVLDTRPCLNRCAMNLMLRSILSLPLTTSLEAVWIVCVFQVEIRPAQSQFWNFAVYVVYFLLVLTAGPHFSMQKLANQNIWAPLAPTKDLKCVGYIYIYIYIHTHTIHYPLWCKGKAMANFLPAYILLAPSRTLPYWAPPHKIWHACIIKPLRSLKTSASILFVQTGKCTCFQIGSRKGNLDTKCS